MKNDTAGVFLTVFCQKEVKFLLKQSGLCVILIIPINLATRLYQDTHLSEKCYIYGTFFTGLTYGRRWLRWIGCKSVTPRDFRLVVAPQIYTSARKKLT
jgi:hypothetical protein